MRGRSAEHCRKNNKEDCNVTKDGKAKVIKDNLLAVTLKNASYDPSNNSHADRTRNFGFTCVFEWKTTMSNSD